MKYIHCFTYRETIYLYVYPYNIMKAACCYATASFVQNIIYLFYLLCCIIVIYNAIGAAIYHTYKLAIAIMNTASDVIDV